MAPNHYLNQSSLQIIGIHPCVISQLCKMCWQILSFRILNVSKFVCIRGQWFNNSSVIIPPAQHIVFSVCLSVRLHHLDLLHHLEKGKEELSPLQYHIKSLQYHIKTLQEEFAKEWNIPWTGLCRGCVLGTFSTLKSGMSPIILTVRANVPTHSRFMNGNITEVTPEKLQMSPYFSMVWVICPHFSKALAEHCMDIKNYLRTQITLYEKDKKEEAIIRCSLLHGTEIKFSKDVRPACYVYSVTPTVLDGFFDIRHDDHQHEKVCRT